MLITQRYPVRLYYHYQSSPFNGSTTTNTILLDNQQNGYAKFDRCIPSNVALEPSSLVLSNKYNIGTIKIVVAEQPQTFLFMPSSSTFFLTIFELTILIFMCSIPRINSLSSSSSSSPCSQETTAITTPTTLEKIPQTDSEWQHFFEKFYS